MNTEVRWLSKGTCLNRLITLWDSTLSFLDDSQFTEQLLAAKCDVYYLTDIFEKLNLLNKQLQGENYGLIFCKGAITTFQRKLQLYKTNINRRAFEQFLCLVSICSDLHNDDLAWYGEHLENLRQDSQVCFSDLLMMM